MIDEYTYMYIRMYMYIFILIILSNKYTYVDCLNLINFILI